MGRTHDEVQVVRDLTKKGCKVFGNIINVPKNAIIGNGTLGKIDFLIKYRGYVMVRGNEVLEEKEGDTEKRKVIKSKSKSSDSTSKATKKPKVIKKIEKIEAAPVKKVRPRLAATGDLVKKELLRKADKAVSIGRHIIK